MIGYKQVTTHGTIHYLSSASGLSTTNLRQRYILSKQGEDPVWYLVLDRYYAHTNDAVH